MNSLDTIQLLIRAILAKPMSFDWSIQGLGMLRMYLSKELRLHVWSPDHSVEGVSELHTHPWDFRSMVVCGTLVNRRYRRVAADFLKHDAKLWHGQKLQCGTGSCLKDEPFQKPLCQLPPETYKAGQQYRQTANEIHQSLPEPGTVTLVSRKLSDKADADHAYVFWPAGTDWVSAEPRPATEAEVIEITTRALTQLAEERQAT